jgi:hypothetical protein
LAGAPGQILFSILYLSTGLLTDRLASYATPAPQSSGNSPEKVSYASLPMLMPDDFHPFLGNQTIGNNLNVVSRGGFGEK